MFKETVVLVTQSIALDPRKTHSPTLTFGFQQAQLDGKNLDVKAIMDTWTLQMNYPVVTLTQSDRDNVKVTQTRFLRDRTAKDPGKYVSPYE